MNLLTASLTTFLFDTLYNISLDSLLILLVIGKGRGLLDAVVLHHLDPYIGLAVRRDLL